MKKIKCLDRLAAEQALEVSRLEADKRIVEREITKFYECLSVLELIPEDFGTSKTELQELYRRGLIAKMKKQWSVILGIYNRQYVHDEIATLTEYMRRLELKPEDIGLSVAEIQIITKQSCIRHTTDVLRQIQAFSSQQQDMINSYLAETYRFMNKNGLTIEDLEIGPVEIKRLCTIAAKYWIEQIRRKVITVDWQNTIDRLEEIVKFGQISYTDLGYTTLSIRLVRRINKFSVDHHLVYRTPFTGFIGLHHSPYFYKQDSRISKSALYRYLDAESRIKILEEVYLEHNSQHSHHLKDRP